MYRVVIISAHLKKEDKTRSDEEILHLIHSLQMEAIRFYVQEVEMIQRITYVGKGKLAEWQSYIQAIDEVDAIVINDDLTPLQWKTFHRLFNIPIYDRTGIILEIFSQHAQSKEARLQVEIAKIQYAKTRMVEENAHYAQVTSGRGHNKGLGEKEIDLKRGQYRDLLAKKRAELASLVKQRKTMRGLRKKNGLPLIAIVGYTNAGKSSLLNAFLRHSHLQKSVKEEDRLFATLETSTRKVEFPSYPTFLCTDTVGFIDHLPTTLIEAFQSTLEEIKQANLLIHVLDISDSHVLLQKKVTEDTLKAIGVVNIPTIYLYNKIDLVSSYPFIPDEKSLFVSTRDDEDIEMILQLIFQEIRKTWIEKTVFLPYDKNIYSLQKEAYIVDKKEKENGYEVHGYFPLSVLKKWQLD